MVGRNFWFVALLVAAVVVPYHLSEDTQWNSMNNWWQSMWSNDLAQSTEFGQYRSTWPGDSTTPTATTSPLPPHYARRPIRSASSTELTRPAPRVSGFPQQTLSAQTVTPRPSGQPSIPSTSAPPTTVPVRPRYHDWMSVQPSKATSTTLAGRSASIPADSVTLVDEANGELLPGLCGPNATCVSHLLNFDITPAWVMNNWQRVSTRLADFDLEGLRVPVMTGTAVDDLAGSMTYYFDRRQTLQRIVFDGNTGEPTPLVNVLSSEFGLEAEPWLGAGFFTKRKPNKTIISVLRVIHAPVIRASDARRRYSVEFELNRKDSEFGLSDRFAAVVQADRESHVLQNMELEPTTKTSEERETDELVKRLEAESQRDNNKSDKTSTNSGPQNSSPLFPPPAYAAPANSPPSVGTSLPVNSPSQISDPFAVDSPSQPQRSSPNVVPPSSNVPPEKPKPINGSADPPRRGWFGQLLENTTSDGPKLYPSQLPNSGQTYIPPPR